MRILHLIIFSLVFSSCASQITEADKLSRMKADNLLKQEFVKDTQDSKLLFSISDKWYMVITKKEGAYNDYYYEVDSLNTINEIQKPKEPLNKTLMNKAFNFSQYNKSFTTFESSKYKNNYELSQGNKTYFVVLNDEGNRYGEFALSVIIEPTPINKEVYYYLVTRLTNVMSHN